MSGRGSRKIDQTGRSTTSYKSRKAAVKLPSQQFIAVPREMLESAAFQALSAAGLRVLMRLCIEHLAHGGAENGNLCVTHRQFVEYGVGHNSVKAALVEVEALGFMETTVQGGKSFGDTHLASRFRLTFPQGRKSDPTHEWTKVRDSTHAAELVAGARAEWLESRMRLVKAQAVAGIAATVRRAS